VFACVFGGGLLGVFLRAALPESHLSADSKASVTLGMGLVGTMTALVLGLLIASAASSFDTQKNELTALSANVVLLDRLLGHYGPETKNIREMLRSNVARTLDEIWPESRTRPAQVKPNAGGAEVLYESILELSPKDEQQRTLKAQAINVALEIGHARELMFEQQGVSISTPLLVVVVFWLTIIFISFGLFAPPNGTAIAFLCLASMAVSGRVMMILELDTPFSGLIHISGEPIRHALQIIH